VTITGITDTYLTGGTYSDGTITFVNNFGGGFNVTGLQTGGGGGGVVLSSVTYSSLITLINTSSLVTGTYYLINDFQTCYDQPDYDINGDPISGTYKQANVEPIIVLAIDVNQISDLAYQPTYPKDRIKYDPTFNTTENTSQPAKGRITERIDEFGNRTDYDHRTILFKRYKNYNINLTSFIQGTVSTSTISSTEMTVIGNGTNFTSFSNGQIFGFSNYKVYEVVNIVSDTEMVLRGNTVEGYPAGSRMYNLYGELIYNSYKQNNISTSDFAEYKTFESGDSLNNYIGDYAKYRSFYSFPFLLSNNVFIVGTKHSNKFGDISINNTFYGDVLDNTTGSYFQNNIIRNPFVRNTVLNNFENNNFYINNGSVNNNFSTSVGNNYVVGGDNFSNNNIGINFNNNKIISSNFENNTINNVFGNNDIFSNFISNNIGIGFINNSIYFTFDSNDIGDLFEDNQIGEIGSIGYASFSGNKISRSFYNNKIFSNFTINTINLDFYSNFITYLENNVIGNGFYNNTISLSMYTNNIKSNFYNNILQGSDFSSNDIGNYFNNNKIGLTFDKNKIGDDFYNNFTGNRLEYGWASFDNVYDRTYENMIDAFDGSISPARVLGKELIMHDTINNRYHKVKFLRWSNNGNGFSYERQQIYPSYGDTITFTKLDNTLDVDVIVPGVLEITRTNNSPIYNKAVEGGWNGSTPANTKWNSVYSTNENGVEFRDNNIGNNFQNNLVGERFGYNKIGNYFNNNNIKSDFGRSSSSEWGGNVVGDYFIDNQVGKFCFSNTFANYFNYSNVGYNFKQNQINTKVEGANFVYNYGNILSANYNTSGTYSDGTYNDVLISSSNSVNGKDGRFNIVVESNAVTSVEPVIYGFDNGYYDFGEYSLANQFQVGDVLTINGNIIGGTHDGINTVSYVATGTTYSDNTYLNLSPNGSTSINGNGADINIEVIGGVVTGLNLDNIGNNYRVGDRLIINGSVIGGTDGVDDVVITVDSLSSNDLTITVQQVTTIPQLYKNTTCQVFKNSVDNYYESTKLSYYDNNSVLTIDNVLMSVPA
jgi:hypothetical protein